MNPTYNTRYPRGGDALWADGSVASGVINGEFFGAAVSDAGYLPVWTGAAYARKPAKVWTGAAWVIKPAKRWTSSLWSTT